LLLFKNLFCSTAIPWLVFVAFDSRLSGDGI
jgi:hypothetical protein